MKIVLDEQDIADMIKEHFDGVVDVSFNKAKINVNVTIEAREFKKKSSSKVSSSKVNNEIIDVNSLNEEAKKKGAMASGGKDRFIAKVG